jgi:thioredoxin 1
MKSIAYDNELNVSSGLFAVKFTADWCGPCRTQQPNIDKMEAEFPTVKFLCVDTDKFPQLTRNYGIKSLPTLVLIKDGNIINKVVGITLIAGLRTAFIEFTK